MSVQPATLLEVRQIFQHYTGLSASSLGILHYVNSAGKYTGGGGYHCGNDLLRLIGKQDSDYSKRESERDRPGSNYGCAIDIGRFRVTLPNGRTVTNHDMTRWMLAEIAAGAPDTLWIREIIYSLDDKNVKRYDRLGQRSSGDDSHLSHEHYSSFRDDIESPHIPALFRRFWAAMEGKTTASAPAPKKRSRDVNQYFAPSPDGNGPRWATCNGSDWTEYDMQDEGTAEAIESESSYTAIPNALYVRLRQPYKRAGRVLDGTGPLD